jgi:Domain of unknown function (DUF4261)
MQMFTQCACILFDDVPPLDELHGALERWPVVGEQQAASGEDGWVACGRGVVVELRSGAAVIADVVERPFPDDPRAVAQAPALDAAWGQGTFGPTAKPGALARAKEQAWTWAEGAGAADRHRAFVRLRTLVDLNDGELPEDHDPLHELTTLTEMAGDVLRLRGATALFMPGGEALRSREQVDSMLRRKTGLGPPPIELWLNLRAAALGEEGELRWKLVDVVGMGQLRLPDAEAVFVDGQEQAEAVAPLLRNACLHLVSGKDIPDGSTADDARGRRWRASSAQSLLLPGRPVVRWFPEASAQLTETTLARLRGA